MNENNLKIDVRPRVSMHIEEGLFILLLPKRGSRLFGSPVWSFLAAQRLRTITCVYCGKKTQEDN